MAKEHKKDINDREVIAEFEERRSKLSRIAIIIGITIGAVALMARQNAISNAVAAIILTVSFVCALIVHVKIWRCPSCNGHLGRLYPGLKLPKFCPHCGIKLIEE